MPSPSRASALARAALASSRSTQTYPKASPLPSVAMSPSSLLKGKGKARYIDDLEDGGEFDNYREEEEESSMLSSRQKRLSRAARFGASYSSSPISLPTRWDSMAYDTIEVNDKQSLRTDYLRRVRDGSGESKARMPRRSNRPFTLHMAYEAPRRYSAIYTALRQVRIRLGPDEEGLEEDNGQTWTPSHIVEYGCATGEGLWAAMEAFGAQVQLGKEVPSYVGHDTDANLVGKAVELVRLIQSAAEEGGMQMPRIEDHIRSAPIVFNAKGSFSESLSDANSPPAISFDNPRTLVLSSYTLEKQADDNARLKHVDSLCKNNPSAEVLVFVEEATERGFAAIASVREHLLGLDKSSTPYSEDFGSSDSDQPILIKDDGEAPQWHVVAPCPHDKRCPLLHDFIFAEPPSNPTTRTSHASSPLFHGATLGMSTCSFPARYLRPSYMRRTTQENHGDENVYFCYLVVRRGPRPSIARQIKKLEVEQAAQIDGMAALRLAADKTKVGDIEELRAGSRHDSVPFAEEIVDEEVSKGLAASEMDENLAKDELMKILPEALRAEMQNGSSHEDYPEVDEALRMAQDVMQKSASLKEDSTSADAEVLEGEKEGNGDLAAALLQQAEQLSGGMIEPAPTTKASLTSDDISAMRLEAYQWPRMVRKAIKKSGHVTFDVCCHHGSIDRFTVAKSAGKQVFQDARKSSHGDLFPHVPFTDEEEFQVSIKSNVVRVPPAGDQRSGLPATFHKVVPKSVRDYRGEITPALAIGPDRVAPRKKAQAMHPSSGKKDGSRRVHLKEERERERRPRRNDRPTPAEFRRSEVWHDREYAE